MINVSPNDREFVFPFSPEEGWWRTVDTARAFPDDLLERGREMRVAGSFYRVASGSAAVLVSRPGNTI
jgi:hypothetical protein